MQLDYSSQAGTEPITLWKPNDGQQTEALSRTEFEILYGGARGGGKTDAGIVWIAEPTYHKKYRGLVIRRNAIDLGDWIDRAEEMFRPIGGKKVNTKFGTEFHFPSGAKIRTGHLKDDGAYTKYQGHEYHRVLIEELTHIPGEELYLKLISCCRSKIPELKPQVFCTTNPGEVGHIWVKERFVDIGPPNVPVPFKDEETGVTKWRIFIPARIEDNPKLLEADPGYLAFLNQLPEDLRKAWREGDWSVYDVKGAYYSINMKQARREGRICRLPYETHLPVSTYWDLGTTAIWFGQFPGKEIRWIRYMEFESLDFAVILPAMKQLGYVEFGEHVFPHDMAVRESNGRTRLQTFHSTYRDIFGVEPRTKINPRADINDGINAVKVLMPRMFWDSELCKQGVKCMENYRKEWDENKQTFRDTPLKDWASHGADAKRTFGDSFKDPSVARLAPKPRPRQGWRSATGM